jgi:hypothetical protein
MKDFEKRIKTLEKELAPKYITLTMVDGTQHRIPAGLDLLHFFHQVVSGWDRDSGLGALYALHPEAQWLMEAVSSDESGHLLDLFRVLVEGPVPRGTTLTTDE